jgi:hypothetical protein
VVLAVDRLEAVVEIVALEEVLEAYCYVLTQEVVDHQVEAFGTVYEKNLVEYEAEENALEVLM